MPMIKVGARVRQKPRLIEGIVTKREIIGEGITYFVHDESSDHEIPLDERSVEWISDPVEDAAPEAPADDPAA